MRHALAAIALLLPLAARATGNVELSQGADQLSGGRAAWRATVFQAAWKGERGAAIGAGVRELSRFSRDDVDGVVWAQAPLGDFVVGVEGSASPTWRFVPRWAVGGRIERGLGAGWIASAGMRAARYESELTSSTPLFASAGLERYWGRWRAAATTMAVGLGNSWSGGGRLALDLFYGNDGRVGVSAAAGRELESLGEGQLLRSDVLGAAIAGAHPLRGAWAVTWELSGQRQGVLYTRIGGRLGLRRAF